MHLSTFGSIDAIDHDFGNASGFYAGSLSGGTDDLWVTFDATVGDVLSIAIDAPAYKNAVLLQDTADGVFNVGDVLGLSNFNVSHVGEGTDLTVLSHIGPLEFSGSVVLNHVATYTGQYGIAVSAANDDHSWAGGPIEINVSGNTQVPEPGSIAALLSLAGCGVGAVVVRRRRAKKRAA